MKRRKITEVRGKQFALLQASIAQHWLVLSLQVLRKAGAGLVKAAEEPFSDRGSNSGCAQHTHIAPSLLHWEAK